MRNAATVAAPLGFGARIGALMVDAFALGFRVMVPHDCAGDHDLAAHDQNLKDVERHYADIIDGATAIEGWREANDKG
jgi:maleamate amidohydrolase